MKHGSQPASASHHWLHVVVIALKNQEQTKGLLALGQLAHVVVCVCSYGEPWVRGSSGWRERGD